MTDRIGGTQSTRKPQAPSTAPIKPAAPAAVEAPAARLTGDAAVLSATATAELAGPPAAERRAGDSRLDSGSVGVGVQTFLQGIPRALGALGKSVARAGKVLSPAGKLSLRFNKGILLAADLLDGNNKAVGKTVGVGIAWTRKIAPKIAGRHADKVVNAASATLRGAGHVARALGKMAPVLNIAVAGYDSYKASAEGDPAKQKAAWANAGLSIGSTALALGGLAAGGVATLAAGGAVAAVAAPAAVVLGAGAAVVAGFQLVDTLAFDGKFTAKLAETKVGSAIADGAKKTWNALTSL